MKKDEQGWNEAPAGKSWKCQMVDCKQVSPISSWRYRKIKGHIFSSDSEDRECPKCKHVTDIVCSWMIRSGDLDKGLEAR